MGASKGVIVTNRLPCDRTVSLRRFASVALLLFLIGLAPASFAAADPCGLRERAGLIQSVHVTGSSLSDDTLSVTYNQQIGTPDTPDARKAIAKAIAELYSSSDIALYDVSPAPARTCGVVEIAVTEGRVGSTIVEGELSKSARRLIGQYLANLTADYPLHVSTLQRNVSMIREVAGVNSSINFQPTAHSDVVQLLLKTNQSRGKVVFSADNRGANVIGDIQMQISSSLYNVINGGDELNVTLAGSQKTDRLIGISGSYYVPLDTDGTRFSGSAARFQSNLPQVYYQSTTTTLSSSITRPVIKNYQKSVVLSADLRHTSGQTRFFGYDLLNVDAWSIGPSVSYSALTHEGEFAIAVTSAFGSQHRTSGLVYLSPERRLRRLTIQGAIQRTVGHKFLLRVNSIAQLGTRNLPTTDQLVFGGSAFGRAFNSGFAAGDSGFVGLGEVAIPFSRPNNRDKTQSEAYVFIDGGRLSYHDPLSSMRDPEKLLSVGAGARINQSQRVGLYFEAATGTARIFGTEKAYQRLSIGLHYAFSIARTSRA